jgi:hypothetical protein
MTDELSERFQGLRHSGTGDWDEVLRRAGKRRGRRRLVVAVAAGALALAVPTAFALHGSVIDFLQSEPAPARLVQEFERMDEGAPPHLDNRVVYGQTRKVFVRILDDGKEWTLWVAPNRKGGYCTALVREGQRGGFGCLWADRPPVSHAVAIAGPITSGGVIEGGPFLVSGSVEIADAQAVEIEYEDGSLESQALTWVSEPIDAAFFLFDVHRPHWQQGSRPERLVVRDADGQELFAEPLKPLLPPVER